MSPDDIPGKSSRHQAVKEIVLVVPQTVTILLDMYDRVTCGARQETVGASGDEVE